MVTLTQLLKSLVEQKGTELHLTVNSPPQVRVDGALMPLSLPPFSAEEVYRLMRSAMSDKLQVKLAEAGRVRFGFRVKGFAQFEVHVYHQRGFPSAVYKYIDSGIQGFRELRLPEVLGRVQGGLQLIGGAADSGRSTTLAAVVDKVNREYAGKLTIVAADASSLHSHKKGLVDHILVGKDVESIDEAMDIIIGFGSDLIAVEGARNPEDWSSILHAAQCGVTVLATCFGRSSISVIQEIVHLFPPHQQSGIRRRLAQTLNYVLVQKLLPRAGGKGRIMASELMLLNKEARSLIQSNQLSGLNSSASQGAGWAWNQYIAALYFTRWITLNTALTAALDLLGDAEALQGVISVGPKALRRDDLLLHLS